MEKQQNAKSTYNFILNWNIKSIDAQRPSESFCDKQTKQKKNNKEIWVDTDETRWITKQL